MQELKRHPQLSEFCFLIFQDDCANALMKMHKFNLMGCFVFLFFFLNKTSAEYSAYEVILN